MHAHLSGSIRDSSILELLREEARREWKKKQLQANPSYDGLDDAGFDFERECADELKVFDMSRAPSSSRPSQSHRQRTLTECFAIFRILHRLIANLDILRRVTRDVIQDFVDENVAYLELRTTPRKLVDRSQAPTVIVESTKREYIQAVIDTIRACQQTIRTPNGHPIHVRLLLSVDRSESMEEAEATLKLAQEFSAETDPIVVGMDFSGNPNINTFRTFRSIFERAREFGLESTIHIGEKWQDGDDLDCALFEFKPKRIGHVVCLEERHIQHLIEKPVPIEICPTSNLMTKIVDSLKSHPFGRWRSEAKERKYQFIKNNTAIPPNYPMVICTDDSGVFDITLTSELYNMSQTFELDAHELFHLEAQAVEYGFMSEKTKAEVRKIFSLFHDKDEVIRG